ncbi:hypothetical protein HK405_005774 [Cladochytrium tenue]|nr:hypothetical protein HK405_005774 [Cladochytrium tenue]
MTSTDPIHFFKSLNASIKANFSRSGSFSSPSSGPARRTRERANLLSKFQRAWDTVMLDYQTDANWTKYVSQTDIVKSLQTMGDILVREHAITDGGVETGGCTELFLNDDMMANLVRISENDVPFGFRGEVIRFLSNLVSVLDAKILIQNAIHRPTLTLIRWCLADKEMKYEDEMLQLEYDIAAKIHEFPQLLYIFFSRSFIPKNVTMESAAAGQAVTSAASLGNLRQISTRERPSIAVTGDYEFSMFDHLLKYVHLEGNRGDFAREACLFILELANGDLADYINKSEFASMAIAGLAGSYSQLPSRVPRGVAWGETFRGAGISGGSGSASRVKRSAIDNFRADMESFMRLLEFVQGVVIRCPSRILTSSILVELKDTFLDNIVQSTLTSASDFDGTTVAYMFYILQMLESIREDQISALFCHFLLSGDDDEVEAGDSKGDDTPALNNGGRATPEMRLHLRDILISKLNSLSEEVVTVTLNVFQSLLSHHSHHALPLLVERLPTSQRGNSTASKTLWKTAPNTTSSPIFVNSTSLTVTTISTDIRDHLSMVSRYFALVPADHPVSFTPSHTAFPLIQQLTSDSSTSLPESVSLAAYLAEAENVIRSHKIRHPRARAAPPVIMARGSSLAGNSAGDMQAVRVEDVETDMTSPTEPTAPAQVGNVITLRSSWQQGKHMSVIRTSPGAITGDFSRSPTEADAGFEGGLLSATSPLREWMLDLSRDGTIRKFLVKFTNFFSHSYDINLALTGVITQLAAAPIPILYMYLFSADLLLGSTFSSLYTILIRLRREVEERRALIPDFDKLLQSTRQKMFHEQESAPSDWLNAIKRETEAKAPKRPPEGILINTGDLDLDAEFVRNVVILEEFVKELLSVLVTHGSYSYDQISYV